MKRTLTFLFLYLLGSWGFSDDASAQLFTYDQGDPYMVEKIQEQLIG